MFNIVKKSMNTGKSKVIATCVEKMWACDLMQAFVAQAWNGMNVEDIERDYSVIDDNGNIVAVMEFDTDIDGYITYSRYVLL